jgi:hypothetical protein
MSISRKSVEKFQFSLKSNKNKGTLHEDLCTLITISRWIILRMGNFFRQNCRAYQITHFAFNNLFRKSCHLWKYVGKCGTARQATRHTIIRRERFACWIAKAANTHSEHIILIVLLRQQWFGEDNVSFTYIACLVFEYEYFNIYISFHLCSIFIHCLLTYYTVWILTVSPFRPVR